MRFAAFAFAFSAACSAPSTSTPAPTMSPTPTPTQTPTQFPSGTIDNGTRTAYPLVLVHGLDGFKNIGPIDYFYGVADALRKDGHTVEVAVMDPYNSSEVRGAELQSFVEQVLQSSGADKVKMICHSQGGLDCRYVASNLGAKIAAIVTISSPHRGTPVADIAVGDLPGPMQQALDAFLNVLGAGLDNGNPNMNAQAALDEMTAKGAAAFAARHPDSDAVAYYSIAGRSNSVTGDLACASDGEAPFIARWDGNVDPINALLSAPGAIINGTATPPPTNDGLVPVASARYGTFLGCVPADHLDEMNQIAGAGPGAGNPFDAILFYRQLAAWMVERGY
jgi:triacylglycerol lipase